jgi:hypothetical protein
MQTNAFREASHSPDRLSAKERGAWVPEESR